MPTYDYKREDGTFFELYQPITAEPLTKCPTTGQPVQRVISGGTGFIFKGSGFYQTDYVAKPTDDKSSEPKTDDKKTESTSNSKPKDEKQETTSKNED